MRRPVLICLFASLALAAGPGDSVAGAQDRAIALLRLGTVRITTRSGTDFMFRTGTRRIDKKDGAVLVTPPGQSAFGQIAIPEVRFGDAVVKKLFVQVDNGRISGVRAEEGLDAVKAALAAGGEAAHQFREFALALPSGAVRLTFGVHTFTLNDATLHVDFRYLLRDGKVVLEPEPSYPRQ